MDGLTVDGGGLKAALKQKGIHHMIEEARKTSPDNNSVKGLK